MSTPEESAPEDAQPGLANLHLVESRYGWLLTINLTDDDVLEPRGEGPQGTVTVLVEPNLLPGHPFTAQVKIVRPVSASATSAVPQLKDSSNWGTG